MLELSDDDVAAALADAPVPPSITSLALTPDGPAPSGFAAEIEVRVDDGHFEVDVNTPGTADERPLVNGLAVDDEQRVRVVTGDPTDQLTLVDQRSEPGGGAGAPADGSRVLELAVGASYPLDGGQTVSIPVLLVHDDAAAFDAASVAGAIEAWRTAVTPPGALVLQFDLRVGAPTMSAPLLDVRGVRLPLP